MNRRAILSLSATMVLGLFWSLFLFAALDLGLSELSAGVRYYDLWLFRFCTHGCYRAPSGVPGEHLRAIAQVHVGV
jgi:hypothetical protein